MPLRVRRAALDGSLPVSLRTKSCKMFILQLPAFIVCTLFSYMIQRGEKCQIVTLSSPFLEGWKFAPLKAISIAKDYLLNAYLLWTVPVSLRAVYTFTTAKLQAEGDREPSLKEALALGFMWLSWILVFHWKNKFPAAVIAKKRLKVWAWSMQSKRSKYKEYEVFFHLVLCFELPLLSPEGWLILLNGSCWQYCTF